MRMKLKIPFEYRKPNDAKETSTIVSELPFFKKYNLKPQEYNDIAINLQYAIRPPHANVITLGEEGDIFYMILKGECSVWVPVSIDQMKLTYKKIKEAVEKTYETLEYGNLPEILPFDLEFVDDE